MVILHKVPTRKFKCFIYVFDNISKQLTIPFDKDTDTIVKN